MRLVLVLKKPGVNSYVVNRINETDWVVAFSSSASAAEFSRLNGFDGRAELVARCVSELPFNRFWLDEEFRENKQVQKIEK